MRDQLLAQVAQCEYAYLKSRLTASMTSAELENYDNSSNQIESEINNIKSNIAATKEDLKEARIIRKNRVECDVLINIIKEQPDRQNTSATLENLKSDLQNLEVNSRMGPGIDYCVCWDLGESFSCVKSKKRFDQREAGHVLPSSDPVLKGGRAALGQLLLLLQRFGLSADKQCPEWQLATIIQNYFEHHLAKNCQINNFQKCTHMYQHILLCAVAGTVRAA